MYRSLKVFVCSLTLCLYYNLLSPLYQLTKYTNIVPNICAFYLLYPLYNCAIMSTMKEVRIFMPVTKAQQRAVNKYTKENYDEIKVRVPKGRKAVIVAHLEARGDGESMNAFISRAIDTQIEIDKNA